MGLVTHVFPDEAALQAGAAQLAHTLAAKSPVAAYGTKRICLHARHAMLSQRRHSVPGASCFLSAQP